MSTRWNTSKRGRSTATNNTLPHGAEGELHSAETGSLQGCVLCPHTLLAGMCNDTAGIRGAGASRGHLRGEDGVSHGSGECDTDAESFLALFKEKGGQFYCFNFLKRFKKIIKTVGINTGQQINRQNVTSTQRGSPSVMHTRHWGLPDLPDWVRLWTLKVTAV